MDVYQASDGSLLKTDKGLADYDSLITLQDDIGQLAGIESTSVLLFTEDGREVRQEVLQEAWERGGQGSHSSPKVIYLFNRETFWTDAEQWATELQEDVQLPPPIQLPITDLAQAQNPFVVAFDHLCHLQSLFKIQARALQIAYASLSHHLEPITNEFATFSVRARRELEAEDRVIRGYPVDVVMLSKVVVHEAFARKRDKEDEKVKTMADWVNFKKMEQVRESCQTAFDDHATRFDKLVAQVDELRAQSETEKAGSDQHTEMVEQEFAEALGRLEQAIEQVEALVRASQGDLEQDVMELDNAMRDDLVSLTAVKNDFTFHVHLHLRQIAIFQTGITELIGPLSTLDADLRTKNAFPHLHRLHQLPFAYAASVVEVVRRKEFAVALLEWTTKISDNINKTLATERRRRQQHKVEMQSFLPYSIAPLDESMVPRVDLSVIDGAEALSTIPLTRADVDNLFTWLEMLEADPEIAQEESPLPELRRSIEDIVAKLRVTPFESADHEKQIAELQRAHLAQQREMEDKHEQRTEFLETRQGELQEELVRLRTDLSEEMLARQALSAELEERARDHDEHAREHEDQRDLIIALQAEVSQEKDRATDLGVRLQEALLDVDGLRSAEQSLVGQLQDLQEERSRTLSSLGEAQMLAHSYESQLAGLRAELDATTSQLLQAQNDRDLALRNQTAEAERLMRDHIAEADGDRAVLEHQNLTLTKELEVLKGQAEDKLTAARNAAIRREDGLKAELSFTKAQLRDMQRRETVLADELAMAKDAASALTSKEAHQAEMAKDAINLASKYHDTCHRLLKAINSSTTISGSISQPPRPKTPPTASSISSNDMRESVLIRSLSAASSFDLVVFAESVTKTINLVKKWSKSCRQYREQARSKITFSAFTKGDLALFLPTRNAAVKAWAAFNIGAPHNFLHVTDEMQQILRTKEYYLARIVRTEEATVGSDTNLYGLAEGLRYYTHHVEEWTPTAIRPSRRSVSASFIPTEETPGVDRDIALSPVTPTARPNQGYFPPQEATETTPTATQAEASTQEVQSSVQPQPSSPPQPSPPAQPSPPPPAPFQSPTHSPASPRRSVDLPAQRIGLSTGRSSSRTILSATASPPAREAVTFAPSSLGRPASVASSGGSSYPRGGVPIPSAGSKAALATAVTSTDLDATSPSSASLTDRPSLGNKSSSGSFSSSPQPQHEGDKFKPSPLGRTPPDGTGTSRFMSGLSRSLKSRTPSTSTQSGTPSAMDMLKRFEGS